MLRTMFLMIALSVATAPAYAQWQIVEDSAAVGFVTMSQDSSNMIGVRCNKPDSSMELVYVSSIKKANLNIEYMKNASKKTVFKILASPDQSKSMDDVVQIDADMDLVSNGELLSFRGHLSDDTLGPILDILVKAKETLTVGVLYHPTDSGDTTIHNFSVKEFGIEGIENLKSFLSKCYGVDVPRQEG